MCGPRTEIVAKLESKYGETIHAVGLAGGGGGVVELLVSDESGSWTLLFSKPNGMTCLLAAGESWETVPPDGGQKQTAL